MTSRSTASPTGLDRSEPSPRSPRRVSTLYDARFFATVEAATAGYDEVVYVLGNGEFHTAALASLRQRSGIVLAHEVRLSGLYRFAADSRLAVPEGVAGSIRRIYGPLLPEGLASSGQVTAIEAERYGLLMAREVIGSRRPLPRHLASRCPPGAYRGRSGARVAGRGRRLRDRVPPGRRCRPVGLGPAAPGTRVMASFGIVDPIKQPHKLVRAFAALADDHPDLALALVGPVSTALAAELTALARGARSAADGLLVTGRVETEAYLAWLDRAEARRAAASDRSPARRRPRSATAWRAACPLS